MEFGIKEINEEYKKLQEKLKNAEAQIKNIEENVEELTYDITIANGKIAQKHKEKDLEGEKEAKEEKEKILKKLKGHRQEAADKRNEIELLKEKIEEKMTQIEQNPEMKKHLDEVIKKQYSRKVTTLEKEKSDLEEEKSDLEEEKGRMSKLQELLAKHPTLEHKLISVINAKKEIEEIKQSLSKLEPSNVDEIKKAKEEIVKQNTIIKESKETVLKYIEKKAINIKEEDIDQIIDNNNGDLKKTVEESITGIDKKIKGKEKQIRGKEKQIKDYNIVLNKTNSRTETSIEETEDPNNTGNPRPAQGNRIEIYSGTDLESEQNPEPEQTEKPKWYQFIKRFKNWNDKRKQQALPEAEQNPEPEPDEDRTEQENTTQVRKEFADSLRYEIVSDIVEQRKKKELKEAKKERKNENRER